MESGSSSRETAFRFIEQWQISGLSQLAFCKENNIRYHVFHYWYKRFRDAREGVVPVSKRFVELKPSVCGSDLFAELCFTNGNRIAFHQPVAVDYLKSLVG